MSDFVVVPKAGQEKETARLLLDLADSPRHVRTSSDGPGMTFTVPEYLHRRYLSSGETAITGVKRRGRPPGRTSSPQAAAKALRGEDSNKDGGE